MTISRTFDNIIELNKDVGACYCCGGVSQQPLVFASKERATCVYLCNEHFLALREKLMEFLRDTRLPKQN